MPEVVMDLPHFLKHRRVDTPTLYGCCLTTTPRCTCKKAEGILPYKVQLEVAFSRLFENYSRAMWKSIFPMTTDLPHFSSHHNMDTPMLRNYCWITTLMCTRVTLTVILRCIVQRPTATWRFLGCYLNANRRSICRTSVDRPHYI